MIQIKAPLEGLPIQTSTGKTFWMSPQRDIAYSYPMFIFKALLLLENRKLDYVRYYEQLGGSEQEVKEYASKLADFVRKAADMEYASEKPIGQAWAESGLANVPPRVRLVFGAAFFSVVSSAYYQSMKEANSETFIPFSFANPDSFSFNGRWSLLSRIEGWCSAVWRRILGLTRRKR